MSKKNTTNTINTKSTILSIFKKRFPPSKYKVWYTEYQHKAPIYISIATLHDTSEPCIQLFINNKMMDIGEITRCVFNDTNNISNSSKGLGNTIVKNLIKIGSELNMKQLELVDGSTIINPYKSECNINLSIYKILIEGQSWYNKHGFKSINHETEKAQWETIRNDNFFSVFLKYKDNSIKKKIKLIETRTDIIHILDTYSKLQDSIFIFLDDYSIKCTTKVRDVFKILEKERLLLEGKKNIKEFYLILSDLVNLFNENIKYSIKLIHKL